MKQEREYGVVRVNYDGILSDRLNWQVANLAEFSNRSDLRTDVTIKCGSERPEISYTNVGEILAWKRFANPLDFLKPASKTRESTVRASLDYGQGEIYVNDQVIADEVSRALGRFDEEVFTNRLSHAVRDGLQGILNFEKKEMFLGSILFGSLDAMNFTFKAGLGVTGILLAGDSLAHFRDSGDIPLLAFIGESLLMYISASAISHDIQWIRATGRPEFPPVLPSRYGLTLMDDFPLKPINDWVKGSLYIKSSAGSFVNLHSN